MSPEPKRRLRAPLIDTLVLAGLLALANRLFWPHDPGFASVSPHPTLFITWLLLARYGLGGGVLAAAVGAAEYALLTTPAPRQLPAHLVAVLGAPPVLLLAPVAVFFGMLVQRHISRAQKAEQGWRRAREQAEHLGRHVDHLRDVNVQLGEKIVHADTTLGLLADYLKALTAPDRAQLERAILRLAAEVLGAEVASLWALEGPAWRLCGLVGAETVTAPPLDPSLERAFDAHDVLAAAKLPAPAGGSQLPLLIGRIREGGGGPVVAYLVIDRLPLTALPEATRRLAWVVECASTAMGNVQALARVDATERPRLQLVPGPRAGDQP